MTGEQLSTLVEQAKDQDGNAISQLYEEYHNGVYFLCLKIVKNEDDALDLVQDSFLQALNKLDTLQSPAQFGSWLNQIAANKCRDYLKKKKPVLFSQQQSGNDDEEGDEPEIEDRDESLVPDKALDTEETRRLVMEIIDGLPDLQRMTIMLYYYEEKSIKEISEMMECSENTVKSRLNYARKQIREGVLDLEKKGTKLYGVMPMLFPIIRHSASDFTLPSGASSAVLGNITTSLAAGPAQGTASNIAAKAAGAARKAVTGFSKLSLPAKIGAGVAAATVVVGVGLGVSAAVHHSVPVQEVPSNSVVSSLASSSKSETSVASESPVTSVVEAASSETSSEEKPSSSDSKEVSNLPSLSTAGETPSTSKIKEVSSQTSSQKETVSSTLESEEDKILRSYLSSLAKTDTFNQTFKAGDGTIEAVKISGKILASKIIDMNNDGHHQLALKTFYQTKVNGKNVEYTYIELVGADVSTEKRTILSHKIYYDYDDSRSDQGSNTAVFTDSNQFTEKMRLIQNSKTRQIYLTDEIIDTEDKESYAQITLQSLDGSTLTKNELKKSEDEYQKWITDFDGCKDITNSLGWDSIQ